MRRARLVLFLTVRYAGWARFDFEFRWRRFESLGQYFILLIWHICSALAQANRRPRHPPPRAHSAASTTDSQPPGSSRSSRSAHQAPHSSRSSPSPCVETELTALVRVSMAAVARGKVSAVAAKVLAYSFSAYLCGRVETWCEEETGKVLRLVVARGARDDGVPCLEPAQLRAACAFVGKHREGGSRVLITTPRERAVDALSVGVCCATTISPDPEQVNSNGDTDIDAEEGVHQLLRTTGMDNEDGDHGGGLRDGWRGLLSRDGIEYLAAALFPAPPSPSTSTPLSPSPSSSSPSSSLSPSSFPSPPSSPPPASPSVLHDPPHPIDTADA
ncbi:hypothetical protein B0H14DRAFT_3565075 [Mycena olivaceomarginata]|nr:hypothetical protein B0H14DRAFT_3565075 [Mycena olivaceomarginata]